MSHSTDVERPRLGWFDVSSLLVDFVITSWTVSPEQLGRLLPTGISPEVFKLETGRSVSLVSAVSFINTQFFVGFAPFARLCAPQTNYRAYVRRGPERAVWFFQTQLDSASVLLPRLAFGMPWVRARVVHRAEWHEAGLRELQWRGASSAGAERLSLRGTGDALGCPDGFRDEAEARQVLTHPLVGYFARRSGGVARYSVWHAPLELERCRVEEARYEAFERLGLISPGQAPVSAFSQRQTQYSIFLPPRRVASTA